MWTLLLAASAAFPQPALGADSLPIHSVSGVSAGADMAVNHLVVFSKSVLGAGVVAGAPYGCNLIGGTDLPDHCGSEPPESWDQPLFRMISRMRQREALGLVDPLVNLYGRRLFLYSGAHDRVVDSAVMRAVQRQFGYFMRKGAIVGEFGVRSAHGWVVDGSTCGRGSGECSACCCDPGALLACPGYDLAGRMLSHVLGRPLGWPRASATSPLMDVQQAAYLPWGQTLDSTGMWHTAYIYAPWRCRFPGAGCDVHVHYHGCVWGAEYMGVGMIKAMGLLEWAETAGVVVLFPQASSTVDEGGCWDWTGETGDLFDTKLGVQLQTVTNILRDLERIISAFGGNESTAIQV